MKFQPNRTTTQEKRSKALTLLDDAVGKVAAGAELRGLARQAYLNSERRNTKRKPCEDGLETD